MKILLAAAATAVAAAGSLSQLPGKTGCVNKTGASSCARGRSVGDLGVVTVSPDGRNVYAIGGAGSLGAMGVFARNRTTGALAQLAGKAGCVLRTRTRVCTTGLGMETPSAVAISPDGKVLITAAANGQSLGLYRRAANGALTPAGNVKGFGGPSGLAFSPDGKLLLVAQFDGVWALRRSGLALTRAGHAKCDEWGGCTAVAFSPDGAFAYAVAGGGAHGSITSFSVAPDGTLLALAPTLAHAVKQPRGVAVSPDGRSVYVAASVSDGVAVFARDATTGVLLQTGCVTMTGSQGACAKGTNIAGASSVAVSRDGRNVYVASFTSNAVAVFARAADGSLREMQSLKPRGLSRASGIAVSPDGRSVYAAGHGVAAFERR